MRSSHPTGKLWIKRCLLLGALGLALAQAAAVERKLYIEAPATIGAGQPLTVTIAASTDAGQGEQVGFLQAEVSVDDGKTWSAICYLQKSGPQVVHRAKLSPGAAGTAVRLRVRAAFRDGPAGDVDFSGAAIVWDKTWETWKTPPTKHARIAVK
jgi:hypothetical protein